LHRVEPLPKAGRSVDAQAVKTIGGLAQLAGVIWLLWDLIAQFRYIGQLAKLRARLRSSWNWVQQHVLRRRREAVVVPVSGTASIGASGHATLTVSQGLPLAPAGATVMERLAAMEQWGNLLQQQFNDERRTRDELRQQDREAMQREIREVTQQLEARIAETKAAHARLEGVTVGGVSLRLWSLPVLLIGILCTTWPDGIAEHVLFWLSPSWFVVLVALLCAWILVRKTLGALYQA
jgi:hypothetical protein